MSVTGEFDRILDVVRRQRYHHDSVAHQLRHSPPASPPDGDLLGKEDANLSRLRMRVAASAPVANEPEHKKSKIVMFERPQSLDTSKFLKEAIRKDDLLKKQASALSKLLSEDTTHGSGEVSAADGALVTLTMHFPWLKGKTLKVRAAESSTVDKVIQTAMKAYAKEKLEPELKQNPLMYVLRMVDDDGTPDEDFPALDRTRSINKFQFRAFAFCENPKAAEMAATASPAGTPQQSAVAMLNTTANKSTSIKGNFFLKVHLPNRQYLILNVSPDMVIRDLLQLVTKKRKLNFNGYCFQLPTVPGAIGMDRTIQSLGTEEVMLSPARIMGSRRVPEDLPSTPASVAATELPEEPASFQEEQQRRDFIVYSEFSASQYKEFLVIKTNKHGVRQERIMGVDRDRIYNMLPKTANGFLGAKAAKRPSRFVEDLVEVQYDDESRPADFVLVFRDGSDMISYQYASKSGPAEAMEIVSKLRFLVGLEQKARR